MFSVTPHSALISPKPLELFFEEREFLQVCALGNGPLCRLARIFYERDVLQGSHGGVGQSRLALCQEFPGPAYLKIFFRELEPVLCGDEGGEPFVRGLAVR